MQELILKKLWKKIVLGGCGILNSVSVFARPKTSVSVSILALKYTKIKWSPRYPHFMARSAHKPPHFTSSRLPRWRRYV